MATPHEIADNRAFRRRTLVVASVVLAVLAGLWLAYQLRGLLFMVFVSVFVAVAMEPPVHWLERRGWKRGAATGVVFLVAILLIALFVWALAPLFVRQINQLVLAIPGYAESIRTFLEETFAFDLSQFDFESAGEDAVSYFSSLGGTVLGGVLGIGATIGGFFIFATSVGLFSFYMIAELPKLQRTVLAFMPKREQRQALHVWDVAVEKMGGYVYSRLILVVVSATIATTFLGFLEVPFALSLGIWVGVLSQFIPVIGTYLAAILPAVVALSSRGVSTMLWVIVFFVAYQQVENYLISPRITKRTMEIHPAISVAAIIIGASLLGGIGVVLALPMAGIIQAILSETGRRHDVILDGPEDQT